MILVTNNLDRRWGPKFWGASPGSKLFASRQNSPRADKELKSHFWHIYNRSFHIII